MKKKALFLGLTYHLKTKSSDFFQNLLKEKYDVTFLDTDNLNFNQIINNLNDTEFELLICWQIFPDSKILNELNYKHATYFPMVDSILPLNHPDWFKVRNFNIICFSSTLQKKLKELGFSTYYIKYFPKPEQNVDFGNPKSVFFWQRITRLNIKTVLKLFKNLKIEHIHIHKSLDPKQKFVAPPNNISQKITYTTWFDKKDDMKKEIEKSAYYVAPRRAEGIGMSFLEAMAMGRCVVGVNYPTMNEYIENGKTGLLFDFNFDKLLEKKLFPTINFNFIKPFKSHDVINIQKNTLEYMRKGFEKFEKEKYKILDWLELEPNCDMEKICNNFEDVEIAKYYLLYILPFLRVENRKNSKKYVLFDVLPILTIKDKGIKLKYFLFGFIPLVKIVKNCAK